MSSKPIVRIIKNWKQPDLVRQTPQSTGVWGNIQFTTEPVKECDYVLVLNYIPKTTEVICAPENIWAIMQEPYIPGIFDWMEGDHEQFSRVYTHHIFNNDSKYFRTQTCLPWHIDRTYDELINCKVPKKPKSLSWITTNKAIFPGHKDRMHFYNFIKEHAEMKIDIFGYGINPIHDKWDRIYPYKYSLAIENSATSDYWTEKISDCFLSFTFPIYYGCSNIQKYFPSDSFVAIDIKKPEQSMEKIKMTLENGTWKKRLNALKEARQLILDKYQLFPFMASQIHSKKIRSLTKQTITLRAHEENSNKK